jgi:ABC-type multidrug transport system fused ATPase/permease subunit
LGGAGLAHAERELAASVAGRLRVALVGALLREGLLLPAPRVLATLAVRLREVEGAVTQGVLTRARAIVQLLPLGACLIALSPALASAAAISVAPFAVAAAALRGRARRASERAQREVEDLEGGVDELVRNADLFRTYGAGDGVLQAVRRSGVAAGASAARVEMARAALSGGNEVMGALAILGAVVVADRLGVASRSAVLLPFAAVFFMAYRPLRDLGDAQGWLTRGAVALRAVRAVTAGAAEAQREPTARRLRAAPSAPPLVELREFGAAARGPATSLLLAPGDIVALIGPTGSGKTTLIRALLGLEKARGLLLVDGADVTDAPAGPDARPFAWVPQEAPLVTGTVAENVMLFGGDLDGASAALRAVGAERLAASSRHELVGPAGRPLSGGERRQVALARALVTGLPVLVLDEPTEGLDADAAHAVRCAISRLRGRRTILIATHRDDVVAITDRAVRLGAGTGSLVE